MKKLERAANIGMPICLLILGIYGIGRSLWLDEAWVANSVNAPSLHGMFCYPNWLQTSPPLFLLLERACLMLFGLSSAMFRIVPLAMALVAAAGMLALGRRVVSGAFAVLGCAVLMFHPTMIEYFRSVKQYSGEVAAVTLVLLAAVAYLQTQAKREYVWLLVTVTAMLPLAYPVAFLLPGIVLAVAWRGGIVRAAGLAGVSGAVLTMLYFVFIKPNYAPSLNVYWKVDAPGGASFIVLLVLGAGVAVRLALSKWGVREWIQLICLLPCALLLVAQLADWYPSSPRMNLFIRPCIILLGLINLEDLLAKVPVVPRGTLAMLLAVLFVASGMRKQFHEGRFQPEEDFATVIRHLKQNVKPEDLLLVHASMREGFILYSEMQGWHPSNVVYGDTGWPCCPRGKKAAPKSSTEQAVIADLDAKIPRDFKGRIWLFHSARPSHWDYVGLDEGDSWQAYFWHRNCPPGPYSRFPNLGVTPMICR